MAINQFGLYPDVIEDVMKRCENALYEAGFGDRAISDMYEETTEMLNDCADFNNLTNSIIESLFATTTAQLKEKGIETNYYVNCDDSHLYIIDEDNTIEYTDGEIDEFLFKQAMKEWQNYGDVNFLDKGGVQVKVTDNEYEYEVIMVVPNPEKENEVFAGFTTIDVGDYDDDEFLGSDLFSSDCVIPTEELNERLAVEIAEKYGLVELSMCAFNENGANAQYASSLEAYAINKAELGHMLAERGVPIDVERLQELDDIYQATYACFKEIVDSSIKRGEFKRGDCKIFFSRESGAEDFAEVYYKNLPLCTIYKQDENFVIKPSTTDVSQNDLQEIKAAIDNTYRYNPPYDICRRKTDIERD